MAVLIMAEISKNERKESCDKVCEQLGHATICPGTCDITQDGHYCEEVLGLVDSFENII